MVHYGVVDIYGEVDCIQAMLEKVQFSEAGIRMLLEDVINRGRMETLNPKKLWSPPKWFACN